MSTPASSTTGQDGGRSLGGGRRFGLSSLGAVPFLAYVAVFLVIPTAVVVVESFFTADGRFTTANLAELGQDYIVTSFVNSLVLSAVTAVIGAVLGALLAYAIASGDPNGVIRRVANSICGVLAQFGGVTLAFAFIATLGGEGLVTVFLKQLGWGIDPGWLYGLQGLTLVYTYFQIPLMVLVFLPALDGVRPQWREATVNLGGTTWDYWRRVAFPLLTPPFLGALLLLFANAFSAFATAAALVNQGGVLMPLQILNTFTSETVLGRENVGKALALAMIVVVSIAMSLYAYLQRRSSRWLR